MIAPKDVKSWHIDDAKNFIRKPLSDGFKAWSTLRDNDQVTMTIHELGHLMAWYSAIKVDAALNPTVSQVARRSLLDAEDRRRKQITAGEAEGENNA